MDSEQVWFSCLSCSNTYPIDQVIYKCECGSLLEVRRDSKIWEQIGPKDFDARLSSREVHDRSGVWRFRECVYPVSPETIVSHPEGGTNLYDREELCEYSGVKNLQFKHEGENPTGSFKDRGMTVATTQAKKLGMKAVACASTGNTSAALAAYAGQAGLKAVVFLPAGKVALGKIAQAIGYGAVCLAIKGNFDQSMALVSEAASAGAVYMVNSLNPLRLEGQKTIIWEIFQDRCWDAPDWIVVPGGNLGNTSAFGKAIQEAYDAGWIKKKPRLATIQAQGANPFYKSYHQNFKKLDPMQPETVATAINIGNPVNFQKAVKSITSLNGVVSEVDDNEIMKAKAEIDRSGIGCEPASASTLAGVKKLVGEGTISPDESVVCILTGHILKDPSAVLDWTETKPIEVSADLNEVSRFF